MAQQQDQLEEQAAAGPLPQVLLRRREHYNQRFRMVRALRPGLDGAAFACSLNEWAAPLAAAWLADDTSSERADQLGEGLYELCLALLQAGHAASTDGVMAPIWGCLHRHAAALQGDPVGLTGRLCNAWLYLNAQPEARPADWLSGLDSLLQARGRGEGDDAALLDAVQLLAWRCGVARFRHAVLQRVANIPPSWLPLLLPVSTADAGQRLLERLRADPWASDDAAPATLREVGRVGGFRGLGGSFVELPEVVLLDGRLLLQDRQGPLQALYADRFGAQLCADTSGPPTQIDDRWQPRLRGSALQDPDSGLVVTLPGEVQSWACDGHTVAVVLRRSYQVRLYARSAEAFA
ncbi:MAG: hypothetical protein KDI37_03870 [Xanthomonadales bacterium]|nr:hypothetical protein [Xanthomonadales bacterium]MCB1640845.1 hypothetical protein [Xanthomonadales bacterium]